VSHCSLRYVVRVTCMVCGYVEMLIDNAGVLFYKSVCK